MDPAVSYDTETTGLSRHKDGMAMFSFSLCNTEGEASVHRLDGSALRKQRSVRTLAALWNDKSIPKVAHNAKFDLGFTEKYLNRSLEGCVFHDTMIMSHMLRNNHPSHALKDLTWELAGFPKDDEGAVKPYTKAEGGYLAAPEHLMDIYQKRDAERCMLLYLFFWPKLCAQPRLLDVYNTERDLIFPTLRMENRGIMINPIKCKNLIEQLKQDAHAAQLELSEKIGWNINPGSRDDVARLLFKQLSLVSVSKTATGLDCVDKEVLQEIKESHPQLKEIDLIMKYRSWSRGSSIISSYLDLADADWVIHPNIKTNGAETGRESCTNPNLQNVEKEGKLLNPFPVPARKCFRPRPGYVNFHLDLQGIEMRLMVHYSGDQVLVDIINNGGDVYEPAARIFYGSRFIDETDPKKRKPLREAAKVASLAIGYGARLPKVAIVLGLTHQETASKLALFRQTIPKLCGLMQQTIDVVRQTGFVETTFGRRLHIPRNEPNLGVPHRIQGTAAEILKRGQIRVAAYLQAATGNEMQMLLPIHDEIIVECPRRRLKDARDIIPKLAEHMTSFPGTFLVPLGAEVAVSTTDWSRKEKYNHDSDE